MKMYDFNKNDAKKIAAVFVSVLITVGLIFVPAPFGFTDTEYCMRAALWLMLMIAIIIFTVD